MFEAGRLPVVVQTSCRLVWPQPALAWNAPMDATRDLRHVDILAPPQFSVDV